MTLTIESRNDLFTKRELKLDKEIAKKEKHMLIFSNVRMILFMASVAAFCIYYFWYHQNWLVVIGTLIAGIFIAAIIFHLQLKKRLHYLQQLRLIQEEYRARTNHNFDKLDDDGAEFVDKVHDYSSDLDLFGKHSLFHLLNVCQTYFGRRKLKDLFLTSQRNDLESKEIYCRQKAVEELSGKIEFLQEFQATGRLTCRQKHSPKMFLEYSRRNDSLKNGIKKIHLAISAFLSLSLVIAGIISLVSSVKLYYVILLVILVQMIISAKCYRGFKFAFESISGLHPELYSYKSLFQMIENSDVTSDRLVEIRDNLADNKSVSGGSASRQLRELHIICLFIQMRSQPILFLILNALFLYDIYCKYFLEKWISVSGKQLPKKMEYLGEWEALMSLSMMKIVYPECSFPKFIDEDSKENQAHFSAKKMGHPLIPVIKQVRNDFSLPSGTALITGSNMSGKTTLLRTVGINAVLAYSGSVCCAEALQIGMMMIGSSMRIEDSLEDGLSTFYSELLRIEKIVRKAEMKRPMLFLIDEIFRGTNSRDRTDGAQLVLKHLSMPWVIGLMSTHDYQLCEMNMDEKKKMRFYYFSERYDEEGIHFDYILSPGVSKSANAKFLMKMVGID